MSEATQAVRLGTTDRRLDPEAIRCGVPIECPLRPGLVVSILPAAMFSPRYRKALRSRVQMMAEDNGAGERDDFLEYADRYNDPEFVANAVVADMQGITRPDGEEVAYTPELGRAVLSDPGNADVLEWVANEAHDFGHFYATQVEEDEKNS